MLTFLHLCPRLATYIPVSFGFATLGPSPNSSSSPCKLTCAYLRFPASTVRVKSSSSSYGSFAISFLTYFSVMKTGATIKEGGAILSTSAKPRSTLISKSVSFSTRTFCGFYLISGLSWGGVQTMGVGKCYFGYSCGDGEGRLKIEGAGQEGSDVGYWFRYCCANNCYWSSKNLCYCSSTSNGVGLGL